ncbi:MAG: glycosyltransferase [Rikenellaceae bacterium]|nr:glycosyltransferase [Rikenellaceae bacterium]
MLDTLLAAYGPWGLALMGVVLTMLAVQLYYYLGRFARLAKFRNSQREAIADQGAPVSIVLTMGEDYLWLENTLPLLLAQDYACYEIVVVYVGNDAEFAEMLQDLSASVSSEHCRMTCTQIRQLRFPITVKTAHNVGIKAAAYENILLTTTDMQIPPNSKQWLSRVAAGFVRGNVVLAYCGVERQKGLGDLLIRSSQMMHSTVELSSAIAGMTYRASCQLYGFTKELYFAHKGFGFLNMGARGEEDLFVQQIALQGPTSVVLGPGVTVRRKRWGGVIWWFRTLREQAVTHKLYPSAALWHMMCEPLSRLLFFVAAIASLVVLPDEVRIAVAVLMVLRYAAVWKTMFGIARRLGEGGLMGWYFVYDLLSPVVHFFAARAAKIKK